MKSIKNFCSKQHQVSLLAETSILGQTQSKGFDRLKELQKAEILAYFKEINNILATIGKHGSILMVGGAALALVHNARPSTYEYE